MKATARMAASVRLIRGGRWLRRGEAHPTGSAGSSKDKVGYERAVDMLLAQVAGRPFSSEIQVQQYDRVPPARPVGDLARATIGIVVSTGIVPRGNPDHLPGARALAAGRYSCEGRPRRHRWESAHGGFNTKILNTRSPDYALPLATLRALEAEGAIGGIYPWIYSTVGNQTAVGPARAIGRRVAEEFRDAGVAAAPGVWVRELPSLRRNDSERARASRNPDGADRRPARHRAGRQREPGRPRRAGAAPVR
jgi:glycine/betaine/sarcosine/D-proline reductase family selenoprotein B